MEKFEFVSSGEKAHPSRMGKPAQWEPLQNKGTKYVKPFNSPSAPHLNAAVARRLYLFQQNWPKPKVLGTISRSTKISTHKRIQVFSSQSPLTWAGLDEEVLESVSNLSPSHSPLSVLPTNPGQLAQKICLKIVQHCLSLYGKTLGILTVKSGYKMFLVIKYSKGSSGQAIARCLSQCMLILPAEVPCSSLWLS